MSRYYLKESLSGSIEFWTDNDELRASVKKFIEYVVKAMRINRVGSNTEGDKIQCKNWKDLRRTALILTSIGYGVSVVGFSDMSDDILTITAEKL